ncbi:flagellar hook-associated protein FlgL [Laribacter hongkongensis]|uniref:flagellar hook-associated protein FlgL n=1 Tax=Laribacter hongkongensis TaxID=168471 RepID=UPI001EFC4D65|nr:flagellar hook-associated protein FlgL [Laribacter hongkongensis]MCG9030607.1 flagellar hook-associated protein FlgL [Laribacter hongkongensis]MCG9093006.1 flagellar hook-associated protein FlgL [Laribacter hongkongensis]
MRISTNTSFLQGAYGISNQQSLMSQLNVQLTTMKRVNTPSDDPVAAARILDISQSDARNSQFIANTQAADSSLQFSESALGQMTELLHQTKELVVQAGNGAMAPENLQQMGAVFQKKLEEMVAVANGTDASGKYLFSGTKSDTPPYSMTGTWPDITITYSGNDGQKSLAISDTRQIAISEPGSSIFGTGTDSAGSFFEVMGRFANVLQKGPAGAPYLESTPAGAVTSTPLNGTTEDATLKEWLGNMDKSGGLKISGDAPDHFSPSLPAGYQISPPPPLPAKPVILDPAGNSTGIEVTLPNAGESVIVRSYSGELAHVMDGVDAGLQSVLTAQASVGSRRLEADNAGKLGEDLSLVYAKTRSNLEDLDVPKAASDLAMAQMALQASQLSFSKVQGMSLFNYI